MKQFKIKIFKTIDVIKARWIIIVWSVKKILKILIIKENIDIDKQKCLEQKIID